jgi:hypothetical protein
MIAHRNVEHHHVYESIPRTPSILEPHLYYHVYESIHRTLSILLDSSDVKQLSTDIDF